MNCRTARERILEADPAELEAQSESPLGQHLLDCGECRAAAQRVLDGMVLLNRELAAVRRRSVGEALTRLSRKRTSLPYTLVPWALAASILFAVVVTRPWEVRSTVPKLELALRQEAPVPVVEDAGGASVVMFPTINPQITVVWFYEENP